MCYNSDHNSNWGFTPPSNSPTPAGFRILLSSDTVTKLKFVCQTHSKAKQTEILEVGAEKGFFAGPSKENEWLMLKNPKLPGGFEGEVFIKFGKTWGDGCKVRGFLLIGWW